MWKQKETVTKGRWWL